MQTQCPECKAVYPITAKQLREERAIFECKKCGVKFDALELLAESPPERPRNPRGKTKKSGLINPRPDAAVTVLRPDDQKKNESTTASSIGFGLEPPPWEKPASVPRFRWDLGFYTAFLLLAVQIYSFERETLSQNPGVRPWLLQTCSFINCTLPVYKNKEEMSVIEGSLQPVSEQVLNFSAAFINDAAFPQDYPMIKLTLFRYNGAPLAERIIKPDEYSPGKPYYKKVAPGELISFDLKIVKPSEKIGGYRYELI
ncbi:MAG: zinc-ribbon and DUF3426 domain-containing protein [Gammaproteobacteria bacterium]